MYRALRGPPLLIPQRIFGPHLSTEKGEGLLLKVVRSKCFQCFNRQDSGVFQAPRLEDWKKQVPSTKPKNSQSESPLYWHPNGG
jgi:hypothetical protein